MARAALHVITDSEFTRSRLVESVGVAEEKVTAIPIGVHSRFTRVADHEIARVLSKLGITRLMSCPLFSRTSQEPQYLARRVDASS